MRLVKSGNQVFDIIKACQLAGVPCCICGGYAIHAHAIKVGIWRAYKDIDVLIDITTGDLRQLHRILCDDLGMHTYRSSGIDEYADPEFRKTQFAKQDFAAWYSTSRYGRTNPIDLIMAHHPHTPREVIERAGLHEDIPLAAISDLLANKKLAIGVPQRAYVRSKDRNDIAILESLLTRISNENRQVEPNWKEWARKEFEHRFKQPGKPWQEPIQTAKRIADSARSIARKMLGKI